MDKNKDKENKSLKSGKKRKKLYQKWSLIYDVYNTKYI